LIYGENQKLSNIGDGEKSFVRGVIKTKTTEMHLDKDGIIHVKPIPNTVVDFDAAKTDVEELRKVVGPTKRPVIVDITIPQEITKEARDYLANQSQIILAQAFFTDSRITRLMANVYMSFSDPSHPTKMFNDRKEALNWLKSFVVVDAVSSKQSTNILRIRPGKAWFGKVKSWLRSRNATINYGNSNGDTFPPPNSEVDQIINVLGSFANKDFSKRANTSFSNPALNDLATAINMMGEELGSTTVSRDFLDSIFHSIVVQIENLDFQTAKIFS